MGIEPGFPDGLDTKEHACNAGSLDSIPGSGRSPGEGNGNPLWYSCLEDSLDRGAWQATVPGVMHNWLRLSVHACMHMHNVGTEEPLKSLVHFHFVEKLIKDYRTVTIFSF